MSTLGGKDRPCCCIGENPRFRENLRHEQEPTASQGNSHYRTASQQFHQDYPVKKGGAINGSKVRKHFGNYVFGGFQQPFVFFKMLQGSVPYDAE
jgi:hypothetical protein